MKYQRWPTHLFVEEKLIQFEVVDADSYISKAEVNEGAILKRLKPRARGRSYLIKKPTCHITIVLKDRTLNEMSTPTLLP